MCYQIHHRRSLQMANVFVMASCSDCIVMRFVYFQQYGGLGISDTVANALNSLTYITAIGYRPIPICHFCCLVCVFYSGI
jgi:hypothetical protein